MAEVLGLLAQLPGFAPPQTQADGGRAAVPGFAALLQEPPAAMPAATPAVQMPTTDTLGTSVLLPVRQAATGHLSYLAHAPLGAEPAASHAALALDAVAAPSPVAPDAGFVASTDAPLDAAHALHSTDAVLAQGRVTARTGARALEAAGGTLAARAGAALATLFPPRRLQVVARDGEVSVRLRDYALDADAQAALVAALRRSLPAHSLARIVCNGALIWSKEVTCP